MERFKMAKLQVNGPVCVVGGMASGAYAVYETLIKSYNLVQTKDNMLQSGNKYLPNIIGMTFTRSVCIFDIIEAMDNNPKLKLIWCVIDPRDQICWMMEHRVGLKRNLSDIWLSVAMYYEIWALYPDRVKLVKMEGFAKDPKLEVTALCWWLGIPPEPCMIDYAQKQAKAIDAMVDIFCSKVSKLKGNEPVNRLFSAVGPMAVRLGYKEE